MKELCRVEVETNNHLGSLVDKNFHEDVNEVLNNLDLFAEVELSEDTLEALYNFMNGVEHNLATTVYRDVYAHVGGEV